VEAKQFISGMHPAKTMELFDPGIMRKAYRDRLSSLENTVSNFSLYVTFKKDAFPYYNYNLYHYKEKDPWKTYSYKEKDWPEFFLFLSPAIKGQDKFSESAVIFTYMSYDEVKKWEDTKVGRRGNDYEEFKQNRAERMIEFIDQRLPGFKSSIKSYYASTPLTYKDYTGTSYGSMYGVLKDSTNPLKTLVSPRTKVPNLLLTGQNIILHGVLGVTIGSIYTCSELLGMDYMINKVRMSS
jgi:all-trans-retinol 13,14-reductase